MSTNDGEGRGARDGEGGGVCGGGAEGGVCAGGPVIQFVATGCGGSDDIFYAGAEGGGVTTRGDILGAVGGVVEADTGGVGI